MLPNITDELSIEANSVDPEQTGSHCLPLRLPKHYNKREKQTTFVAIGAQALLSLHLSKYHILGNHRSRLNYHVFECRCFK